MIALIKLTEGKIVDVPLATTLNLRFKMVLAEEVVYYDGKLVHNTHGSYKIKGKDCHLDSVVDIHDSSSPNWVTPDGKAVPYYYLASPIPSHLSLPSYAVLEELQMVDLKKIVGLTDLKFEVVQLLQSSNDNLQHQHQLDAISHKLDALLLKL